MKSCVTDAWSPVFARSFCRFAAVVTLALAIARPGAARAADYVLTFSNNTQIVNTSAKITTTAFTVETWFKITTFTSENDLITQYIGGNSGRMVCFIQNTHTCFFLGGNYLIGTATIPSNTWTHIAFVRSGSTGSIYINGVLDKTGYLPSTTLSSCGLAIGNDSNKIGFRGQIADVRA